MATRSRKLDAAPLDQEKPGRGRPTTFTEEKLSQIKLYARLGATDAEIAEAMGITDRQFRKWKYLHPELVPVLVAGHKEGNERVKRALLSRALGYTFDAEEVMVVKGEVKRVTVRKHVPPSDAAAIFWLKNREREEWREVTRTELTGPNDGPIAVVNAPLPADPIEAMAVYQKIMSGGE